MKIILEGKDLEFTVVNHEVIVKSKSEISIDIKMNYDGGFETLSKTSEALDVLSATQEKQPSEPKALTLPSLPKKTATKPTAAKKKTVKTEVTRKVPVNLKNEPLNTRSYSTQELDTIMSLVEERQIRDKNGKFLRNGHINRSEISELATQLNRSEVAIKIQISRARKVGRSEYVKQTRGDNEYTRQSKPYTKNEKQRIMNLVERYAKKTPTGFVGAIPDKFIKELASELKRTEASISSQAHLAKREGREVYTQ